MGALICYETVFASSATSGADSFWRFAEKADRLSVVQKCVGQGASLPTLTAGLRGYGLTMKAKPNNESDVKAVNSLAVVVGEATSVLAQSVVEALCGELRELTLLMRVA